MEWWQVPRHDGSFNTMVRDLGLSEADWLDLSTGVNPHGWAAPTPPPSVWQRLPDVHDGLLEAAREYYGTDELRPVPGSQAALAVLPWLCKRSRVGMISPGYAEHRAAWSRAGHDVVPLSSAQLAGGAGTAFDVLVIINPNNPDGTLFEPEALLEWHARLASRGGWLVVDEAFMDALVEHSLAPSLPLPGLIVLRSMDTFFGLAGIRLGFVLGDPAVLERLEAALGPWTVSGPARWVARQALADGAWQVRMRQRLAAESERLAALLQRHFSERVVGTSAFRTVLTPEASAIHEQLAHEAILVRLLDHQEGLRFGLPPDEAGWERLGRVLDKICPAVEAR